MYVNKKKYLHDSVFNIRNKLIRTLWAGVYYFFFRFSPRPFFAYRRCVLRIFGAKIGNNVNIYPSVKIWLPINLSMLDGSTLGPEVNLYNQGLISIGNNSTISQGVHICSSTHDYNDPVHPLIIKPISIGDDVWVCTEAFIGPGVSILDGCVIGARAVLTKSTVKWMVYAGNPAKVINERNRFRN